MAKIVNLLLNVSKLDVWCDFELLCFFRAVADELLLDQRGYRSPLVIDGGGTLGPLPGSGPILNPTHRGQPVANRPQVTVANQRIA